MKKFLFKENDIKSWVAVAVAAMAVVVKLVLAYGQHVTIYPPLAPIDDHLMFQAAQNIVAGNWLGKYGWLTISKHMFFAVWLAFLHVVKVPYMVGNMVLWSFACFTAVMAVKPVLNRNWQKLFLFLGLLYNPAMSAQYATRIYRDAVFPSLCLMFTAGVVAVGLRYKEKIGSWLVWLVLYGVSFGCIYLCREDGVWIMPLFAAAFVIIIAVLILDKRKDILKKAVAMVLPFVLSAAVIGSYCYMNYIHYGRFIVSDFTSSEFKAAYGALASLQQDNWHPLVSVPEDVREDAYKVSPFFAQLEDNIKSDWIENSWRNLHDFSSGSFYWALRESVAQEGYYENARLAQLYYEQLAREIQMAVDDGRLKTTNGSTKLRKSVTPPIKMEYVPDVLAETFNGFTAVMMFDQCTPYAEKAVGYPEEIAEVADFIHQSGDTGYIPGTDISYMSPARKIMHTVLEIFVAVYKISVLPMFAIALLWQIKKLRSDIWAKKFDSESMLNIVMLGLLGMALLRCAMIAFVEVASFNIGTYVMYLSTVHPLIIMYSFTGFLKTFEY
ncbi:MAG: hypothetical protein IKJ05_01575 [Oscillospiraceae bacterium]|nr:hypothetical protein [Oscillospiraceae bacterium]